MIQKTFRSFVLSLFFAIITIIFTMLLLDNRFNSLDDSLQFWFTSRTSPLLEKIMTGITFLAYTKMLFVLSVLTVAWLLLRKAFFQIYLYCWIMGGAIIITFLMKILIERDRPGDISYVDFWGLGNDIISYSYPSGHAVKGFLYFTFLIYLTQILVRKKLVKNWLTIFFILLIILIGVGQIMLDRHFASDIIGGYLVAMTWFTICIVLIRPFWIFKDRMQINTVK